MWNLLSEGDDGETLQFSQVPRRFFVARDDKFTVKLLFKMGEVYLPQHIFHLGFHLVMLLACFTASLLRIFPAKKLVLKTRPIKRMIDTRSHNRMLKRKIMKSNDQILKTHNRMLKRIMMKSNDQILKTHNRMLKRIMMKSNDQMLKTHSGRVEWRNGKMQTTNWISNWKKGIETDT